ncbi:MULTISPECIES: HGxxPAAW family protein [Streptomyces]|uniref:HGxxPAAW family protein n=1 Tax=Streptomyces sp. 900129855 TaxID=3155129 RepID=A0ABV2ZTT7_9ACTN
MSGQQHEGHQYDEGHTVAGWTGVGIAAVGTGVAGVGVCAVAPVLIAGGLAVVGVSALVTWGLHLTGWGKPPGARPRAEWGMRVRDPGARGGHPGCVGCRLAGRAPKGERPGEGALSVPGPTVAGDGTGMEVRGAVVVGAGARPDVGRGAS